MTRGVPTAYGVQERTAWGACSFEVFTPPNPAAFPAADYDTFYTYNKIAVLLEEAQANFARYRLPDDQVRCLRGFFRDTLKSSPFETLSGIRLDRDMYGSTVQAPDALYAKLFSSGFVVADDYMLGSCRQAVHEYSDLYGITESISDIDGIGSFWRHEN